MSQAHRKHSKWGRLGLCDDILDLVESAGFKEPTEIQELTIPVVLKGKDLIGSARTGSGKTASFALPMIESLIGRKGTYGLILCPTREIALQTQEAIRIFGAPLGVNAVALIGGTDVKADEEALGSGPQILVGTPGRICDHLERGNLWLEFIEMLVLDEADRMLDMGFAKEVSRIVNELPKNRQTLLFSATMAPDVEALARKILHNPERIAVGKSLTPPVTVQQEIIWVDEVRKKRELLRAIEREKGIILIFVSTKDGATRLWRSIHAAGVHDSTYISSNKTQVYREEALQGFKDGKYRVMVATDVAGRGIHVDNVALVINFDLPREPEDYIHRIGRTGRQENRGRAITFATPKDRKFIAAIQKMQGNAIREREAGARGASAQRAPERHSSHGRAPEPRAASRSRHHDEDRGRDRHREPSRGRASHRDEGSDPRHEVRHRRASEEGRGHERDRHRDDGSRHSRSRGHHRDERDDRPVRHEERHPEPRHSRSDDRREPRRDRDEYREPARHDRSREDDRPREPRPRDDRHSDDRHRGVGHRASPARGERHREEFRDEDRPRGDRHRASHHRDEPRREEFSRDTHSRRADSRDDSRHEHRPHRSEGRRHETEHRQPRREPRAPREREYDRHGNVKREAPRERERSPEYTRLETEFPRDREYRNPRELDRERDEERGHSRASTRHHEDRPEREEAAPRRSSRRGSRGRGRDDSRRETRH